MSRNIAVWAGAGIALVLVAFFAGHQLRPEPATAKAFDQDGPAYEVAKEAAGVSKGGFSGFGESPGPDGRTVVAGRVVSVNGDTVTVDSPSGQKSTIRLTGNGPLRRLEASSREALRPGMSVLVRRDGNQAEAVLVVSESGP